MISVQSVPVLPEILEAQAWAAEQEAHALDALEPELRELVIQLEQSVDRYVTDRVLNGRP